MYYKLGQACVTNWGSFVLLQIRANVVTNWGSFIITNQGKCYYKLGQLLQIRVTVITKQGSYYKLGQNVLQTGAGIANQGNYNKLGHNIPLRNVLYMYCKFLHIVSNMDHKTKFAYQLPLCPPLPLQLLDMQPHPTPIFKSR